MIGIIAVQKPGMEIPTNAVVDANASNSVFRPVAAKTPRGMPMTMASDKARIANVIVW